MINTIISSGFVPDFIIRTGIRRLLKERIKDITPNPPQSIEEVKNSFINMMKASPLAVQTRDANEQHYEVPTDFYLYALGPNLKYSCAYFEENESLEEAEIKMLERTLSMARIRSGDKVLELGCGWGSLTLFTAKKFPECQITGVSNSATQKIYIDQKAKNLGLTNVRIITADMNNFNTEEKFDRIVSVEMFEHMRNYEILLNKISGWLNEHGTLFVHIFVHKSIPYLFEVKDESDWMSKYFFSGGMMPSDDIFHFFQEKFKLVEHVKYNGTHYAKTSEEWLKNTDQNKQKILDLFKIHYGIKDAKKWLEYWRIFFMACAELWKYDSGREWFVSHYLLEKKS
jgi:cyclopropane-fatty-acyl-phospholipid synthase